MDSGHKKKPHLKHIHSIELTDHRSWQLIIGRSSYYTLNNSLDAHLV